MGPRGDLLADSAGATSLAAVEALARARNAGIEVIGLTGRSQVRMQELGRLLGLETWICELGAVRAYKGGRETVLETGAYAGDAPLSDVLAQALRALVDRFDTLEEHDPWNEGRSASVMVRGAVDVATAETFLAERGFSWLALVDNGVIPRAFPSLPDVDQVRIFHLVPRGVGKRSGIVADQRTRGLDPAACAVVGDAPADLECADVVGRCFVVRNALDKDPELAAVVRTIPNAVVTRDGHGTGFAEAVDTLLGPS